MVIGATVEISVALKLRLDSVHKVIRYTLRRKSRIRLYKNFQNTEMSEMDFIKLALKEDSKVTGEVFEEYAMLVGIASRISSTSSHLNICL